MRNIVYIATYKRTGSGVLFNCEIDERLAVKKKDDEKSYLILTNYHVIQDLDQSMDDQRRFIDLKIRDSRGEYIDPKHITKVIVKSGKNYNDTNDVAAILVLIKDCCNIPCENDVWIDAKGDGVVSSQGYPHVFQHDSVSRELCLNGELEMVSPEGMGLYKIRDDYHGYPDISDKELMEGISGAPVYAAQNGKEYVIGINQSVCNIGNGKNPFKIVYFIEIGKALSWLASQNILLFEYGERSVKLLWICGLTKELLDLGKPKNIVLIGESRSGKSAFVQSLCQHGRVMDKLGGVDEARTAVRYELKQDCRNPRIEVRFMEEEEFVENWRNQCELQIYEWILCNWFGMDKKDIREDPLVYLRDIYFCLSRCREIRMKDPEDTRTFPRDFYYDECDEWIDPSEWIEFMRKIADAISLCRENDRLLEDYDYAIHFLDRKFYKDYHKEKKTNWYLGHKLFSEKAMEEYRKERETFKENENDNLQKFFEELEKKGDLLTLPRAERFEDFKKILPGEAEGFCVSEVGFTLPEEEDKYLLKSGLLGVHLDIYKEFLEENLEKYCKELYAAVWKQLSDMEFAIDKSFTFDLDASTGKEQEWMAKCLHKADGYSLGGMVKDIMITDRISDDYAYALYKQKVYQIHIYDACGLEQVVNGDYNSYFQKLFCDIYKNGKPWRRIDAILYMKEQYDGKLKELKTILPVINRLEPAKPVYCIFSQEQEAPVSEDIPYLTEKVDAPDKVRKKINTFISKHIYSYAAQYNREQNEPIEMNRKTLTDIWRSILNREWNIGFYVNINKQQDVESKCLTKNDKDLLKKAIRNDLDKMFARAAERHDYAKRRREVLKTCFCEIFYKRATISFLKENRAISEENANIIINGLWIALFEEKKDEQENDEKFEIDSIKEDLPEEAVDTVYRLILKNLKEDEGKNLENLREYDMEFRESLDKIQKVIRRYVIVDIDKEDIITEEIRRIISDNISKLWP